MSVLFWDRSPIFGYHDGNARVNDSVAHALGHLQVEQTPLVCQGSFIAKEMICRARSSIWPKYWISDDDEDNGHQ